jgi:hypothetical protein
MLSEINCPFTESNAGPPLRPALRSTSSTQLGLPMLASGDFVPGLSGTAGQLPLRGPSFRNQSSVENFCEERPPISGRLKLTLICHLSTLLICSFTTKRVLDIFVFFTYQPRSSGSYPGPREGSRQGML